MSNSSQALMRINLRNEYGFDTPSDTQPKGSKCCQIARSAG